MSVNRKIKIAAVIVSCLFLVACIALCFWLFSAYSNPGVKGVAELVLRVVPDVFLIIYAVISGLTEKKQPFFTAAVLIYVVSLIVEIAYFNAEFWYRLCGDCVLTIPLGIALIVLTNLKLKDKSALKYVILAMAIISVHYQFDIVSGYEETSYKTLAFRENIGLIHNVLFYVSLFIISPAKGGEYKSVVNGG